MSKLDEVFVALSNPTRRSIIEKLSTKEETVMSLAKPYEMSLPAISKHLKVLEKSGLVSQRREGKYSFYSVNSHSLGEAAAWITFYGQFWTSQFSKLERFLDESDKS